MGIITIGTKLCLYFKYITCTCMANAEADSTNDGFQNLVFTLTLLFLICVFVGIRYGNSIKLITMEDLKSEKKILVVILLMFYKIG